jgi:hypothetical protein
MFCSLMFHRESMSLEEIGQAASSWLTDDDSFTEGDIISIVNHLGAANKLMMHDGVVHMI